MKKMNLAAAFALASAVTAAALLSGCASQKGEPKDPLDGVHLHSSVQRAEQLFRAGRYTDAIVAATEIARKDPLAPGLSELQAAIMTALAEARKSGTDVRNVSSDARFQNDVTSRSILPDRYGVRRNIKGETEPLRTAPSKMLAVLKKPVTIHLEEASLAAFASQIAESQGVNIVADSTIGEGATVTIHVEDTPLSEVLTYVGRNMGVTFSVGENLIWATAQDAGEGPLPLETRIYRLRKGLAGDELVRPSSGGGGGGNSTSRSRRGSNSLGGAAGGGGGGGGEGTGEPSMIEVIERFVAQPDGAEMLYNPKAHVLVVRNTRENLALTEDIIEAMDITPPQVLIEARFISTSVSDLSEFGVDWLLGSNLNFSRKNDPAGQVTTRTGVLAGSGLTGNAFSNPSIGGNLTFAGVLTDPAFQAVLHILETSGKTRTLSVPRVTTINNRPATIRVGEDFRYYEEYDLEDYDVQTSSGESVMTRTQLVPTGTPTLEELGIELAATPSVGADRRSINLALIPEISEFVRWEYYEATSDNRDTDVTVDDQGNVVDGGTGMLKLPVFRRNRIDTELVVRSGETVIMGGLITSTRTKTREGIPFLSHLPFIGQFFRHDVTEEQNQNLIIFVTATIISEDGEELIPLDDVMTPDNTVHTGVGATPMPEVYEGEVDASAVSAADSRNLAPAAELAAPAVEQPAAAVVEPAPAAPADQPAGNAVP